jgi:hypothetical protein
MTALVAIALTFVGLTATTFPIQQAQAATTPLCGPSSGSAGPVTATTVTYGGKKFDIIGYNKNGNEVGVAGPNNSVTLLLDKDETTINVEWDNGAGNYSGSTISTAMDYFAVSTLSEQVGIIERTLTGNTAGYNVDYTEGVTVFNQKAWPLSVDEAAHVALPSRVFSNIWWLRTPSTSPPNIVNVGANGNIALIGAMYMGYPQALRPALYLNISNPVFTGLNFDNNNLPIGACTREPTNLGIDYNAETVTGLDTATEGWKIASTYAGLGAFLQQASTSTDIDGIITSSAKLLVFVKAADDGDHFDSDKDRNGQVQQLLATTINIPARPAGPNVTGVAPSSPGGNDGKITGTSNKMEYSTDEVSWTAVGGSAITGLTSGTYFVRTIADQSAKKFKSFATEVIVKAGSAGPSAGPGTRPSAGDGEFSSEGTAQTGIDLMGLGLLVLLMLGYSVIVRVNSNTSWCRRLFS